MLKRILMTLTAVLLILTLFTACSGADKDSGKAKDLNEIMNTVNANYDLGSLKTITSTDDLMRFYQIEADSVKQYAAEFSSDSTDFSEVVILEAADAPAVEVIKNKLETHLQAQRRNAKSYSPEQLSTLEACEVQQSGNYVYLVISDQYEEINSAVSEALQ